MMVDSALVFIAKSVPAKSPPFGTVVWTTMGDPYRLIEPQRLEALKLVFLATLQAEYDLAALESDFGPWELSAKVFDQHWSLEIAAYDGDFSTEIDELVHSDSILEALQVCQNPILRGWLDARSEKIRIASEPP